MTIPLWFVFVVLLSVGPPLYLRFTAKADVDFRYVPGSGRTLFVHMPGLMGDGLTQILNIMDTFTDHGDVLTVHYDGRFGKSATKFDWCEAVSLTAREIVAASLQRRYDAFVFIGTSMGGKLAFITAQYLRAVGIHTKAILVDAPLGRRDFQFPLNIASPALKFLPYIPVLNWFYVIPLLERLVIKGMFVKPPKEDQIEPSLTAHERACLDATVVEARKTKMPFHRDEVLAILHPLEDETSPWGLKDVVYVRSKDDNDTVRDEAYDSWMDLIGGQFYRRRLPNAEHCSYGQKPSRYRRVFPLALELLCIP